MELNTKTTAPQKNQQTKQKKDKKKQSCRL